MSDSDNKKKPCRPASQPRAAATKPTRPSASSTQPAVAKPCRPASTPVATVAKPCRPSASAPAPVTTTARPSSRPAAEPVRTPPSRMERRFEPAQAQPRAAVQRPYASTPKPRVGTSVGSFEALAGKAFPTFEERAAASGCVRVVASPSKSGDSPIACITALCEEPRFFSEAVVSFVPGSRPTNAQIQAFRLDGYRYSRETAKLGDMAGRRTVAHCESEDVVERTEIQPDVPVHWFMSPEIPAWKSRAVPTERIGQGSPRADVDRGEESFKAIFEGPTVEFVNRLCDKRWAEYYADNRGTEDVAQSLFDRLRDEIVEEEFRRADRRLEYAFAIGEARFARLWNLALDAGTRPAMPDQPTAEDAIVESVPIEMDVASTS